MRCGNCGKGIDVLNKHAPVTDMKIKGNNLPYINSEARLLIRQRDYLRGKANKTGSEYLRQAYQQIRSRVLYDTLSPKNLPH